jgi:hypothetical protein
MSRKELINKKIKKKAKIEIGDQIKIDTKNIKKERLFINLIFLDK